MAETVLGRIHKFNQGRNPERLLLKYKAMRSNSFVFFRGTCHLFYEDLAGNSVLNDASPVWVCGDLHLENFGSYKGDNRLVYFDINDCAIARRAHKSHVKVVNKTLKTSEFRCRRSLNLILLTGSWE